MSHRMEYSLHNGWKRIVWVCECDRTYLRSSEHHPQKGSLAARHSSQLVNRSHSDIGNMVTCTSAFADLLTMQYKLNAISTVIFQVYRS